MGTHRASAQGVWVQEPVHTSAAWVVAGATRRASASARGWPTPSQPGAAVVCEASATHTGAGGHGSQKAAFGAS
jgi:hypothetical protein